MTGHEDSASGDGLWQIVQDSMHGPIDRTHLVSLVRERYAFHAQRRARIVGGKPVLPKHFTTTVASAVWLDATGSPIAPSVSIRTPTLTSIGQYLSRLARVATDPDKGLAAISTYARFREAEAQARSSIFDEDQKRLKAHAFETFEATLTIEEREAIRTVRRIIREHERLADLVIDSLSTNSESAD